MAREIPKEALRAIVEAVGESGATAREVAEAVDVPLRTVQYRLKRLIMNGLLVQEGNGRSAQYRRPPKGENDGEVAGSSVRGEAQGSSVFSLSKHGAEIQNHVRNSVGARSPVGYRRDFLDGYRPNVSAYLSATERKHLRETGTSQTVSQPAGTYAKQLLGRLLIDLSWNSSRLEGNTYSLLDTKRLIQFGQQAEGKNQVEAQMVLNHKDAIEFLVRDAADLGFNRYTILNLHGMLANNLLTDPDAPGRLRHIAIGIEGSAFRPLEVPQLIEECFDQVNATADAINDPFEQAFFVMVQLPYLQPFDDCNKRVSRLAANIPLVKENLAPLSFIDVPNEAYVEGLLGVYELNKVELLKDVFIWAYERSAASYAAVRQSLGEPDPFRLRHRDSIRRVVAAVVRDRMDRGQAAVHLQTWTRENIDIDDQEPFQEAAETELLALHEGNFARYQIRPSEFAAWQLRWDALVDGAG